MPFAAAVDGGAYTHPTPPLFWAALFSHHHHHLPLPFHTTAVPLHSPHLSHLPRTSYGTLPHASACTFSCCPLHPPPAPPPGCFHLPPPLAVCLATNAVIIIGQTFQDTQRKNTPSCALCQHVTSGGRCAYLPTTRAVTAGWFSFRCHDSAGSTPRRLFTHRATQVDLPPACRI